MSYDKLIALIAELHESIERIDKYESMTNDEMADYLLENVWGNLHLSDPESDLISDVIRRLQGDPTTTSTGLNDVPRSSVFINVAQFIQVLNAKNPKTYRQALGGWNRPSQLELREALKEMWNVVDEYIIERDADSDRGKKEIL